MNCDNCPHKKENPLVVPLACIGSFASMWFAYEALMLVVKVIGVFIL